MLANGVIVDIKTGKPVNEKPEVENAEKQDAPKSSTKKEKK